MKRYVFSIFIFLLVALILGLSFTGKEAQAGTRTTKCVVTKNYNLGETSCTAAPTNSASSGCPVVSCTVSVPATSGGFRTFLVDYSATGDTHQFSAANNMQIKCTVDGANCFNTPTFASGFNGWVVVQNPGADLHDNSLHHTFCVRHAVSTGSSSSHTFAIRLASANGIDGVFNEAITFVVDDIGASPNCTSAGP